MSENHSCCSKMRAAFRNIQSVSNTLAHSTIPTTIWLDKSSSRFVKYHYSHVCTGVVYVCALSGISLKLRQFLTNCVLSTVNFNKGQTTGRPSAHSDSVARRFVLLGSGGTWCVGRQPQRNCPRQALELRLQLRKTREPRILQSQCHFALVGQNQFGAVGTHGRALARGGTDGRACRQSCGSVNDRDLTLNFSGGCRLLCWWIGVGGDGTGRCATGWFTFGVIMARRLWDYVCPFTRHHVLLVGGELYRDLTKIVRVIGNGAGLAIIQFCWTSAVWVRRLLFCLRWRNPIKQRGIPENDPIIVRLFC